MEQILPASSLSSSSPAARATYPALTRRHGVRADDIVPMMEVETVLYQSGVLAQHDINAISNLVQCAVFHSVCTPRLASLTTDVAGDAGGGAGRVVVPARVQADAGIVGGRSGPSCTRCWRSTARMWASLTTRRRPRKRRSRARGRGRASARLFAPSAGSIKLYPEAPPAKVAAQRKRKASPEPAAEEHESPSASKHRKDAPYAP